MATGITMELATKGQSFEEYVLRCAHSMGALISLRDEGLDSKIPDKFEPGEHHQEGIRKAKGELAAMEVVLNKKQYALDAIDGEISYHEEQHQKSLEMNARLDGMKNQVLDWHPGDDYKNLRDLALQQIDITMDKHLSYHTDHIKELTEMKKTPLDYFKNLLNTATRLLATHEESYEKAKTRCVSNTEWVKGLRLSISEHNINQEKTND